MSTDESAERVLRVVQLYTDGACSGNPGPGGWAFILRDVKTGKELTGSGGAAETTNNQMELQAVIEGLSSLKNVLQGLTEWMAGWKARGWVRMEGRKKAPVKNVEQWKQLDELIAKHAMSYHHVRGHSGHIENERCDEMAVAASMKYQ
jgi:ribonuclease HI